MDKYIRKDLYGKIKKALDTADNGRNINSHFQGIVLMGDRKRTQAYSWIHASQENLEKLLLQGMRESSMFAYSAAKALEKHYYELKKEEKHNEDIIQKT